MPAILLMFEVKLCPPGEPCARQDLAVRVSLGTASLLLSTTGKTIAAFAAPTLKLSSRALQATPAHRPALPEYPRTAAWKDSAPRYLAAWPG